MAARQISDGHPEGNIFGQSTTDLISFYGATPLARRSFTSIHNTLTDLSAGTQNWSTGIATITATFVSAVVANAIATLTAKVNEISEILARAGIQPRS